MIQLAASAGDLAHSLQWAALHLLYALEHAARPLPYGMRQATLEQLCRASLSVSDVVTCYR